VGQFDRLVSFLVQQFAHAEMISSGIFLSSTRSTSVLFGRSRDSRQYRHRRQSLFLDNTHGSQYLSTGKNAHQVLH
jgi:hypothetical protein